MTRLDRPMLAVFAILAVVASMAHAHFHVLMPQKVNVQARGSTDITYWLGHPFEHILTHAARPQQFIAVSPEGDRQDLLPTVTESSMKGQEGKTFTTWQATLKTAQRGDYVLAVVSSPAIEDAVQHQAFVKTVVHAKAQKGWDRVLNLPAEIVPLTRPYGLLGGTVFTVQVLKDGKPAAGVMVEVEKYNDNPLTEDKLPPDEYITREIKTDANGIATFNLPESGWWGIMAAIDAGNVERDGKTIPALRHAVYWVFVNPSPTRE